MNTFRLTCNEYVVYILADQDEDPGRVDMQRHKRKDAHRRNGRLAKDLLTLYDGVAEFSDQCAFLCDAFASIPSGEETIDRATARGMSLGAQWIKRRIEEIRLDLKMIHERAKRRSR